MPRPPPGRGTCSAAPRPYVAEDLQHRLTLLGLLGDRVLQQVAWQVADELGWPDTFDAEYVALTKLRADALLTLDARLARPVDGVVTLAPVERLSGS